MTATTAPPLTAGWLLFSGGAQEPTAEHVAAALGGVGSHQGPLAGMSAPGKGLLNRQLGEATHGMLNFSLSDLLKHGWQLHKTLAAAGKASLVPPGTPQVVDLSRHEVSVAHHPSVDIYLNGAKVHTVVFELALAFDVENLTGRVVGGRLVELQVGAVTATGRLSCENKQLVARSVHLDPAFVVSLGRGLALVHGAEGPPAAPAVGTAHVPGGPTY
jgi:hypothetical protein